MFRDLNQERTFIRIVKLDLTVLKHYEFRSRSPRRVRLINVAEWTNMFELKSNVKSYDCA